MDIISSVSSNLRYFIPISYKYLHYAHDIAGSVDLCDRDGVTLTIVSPLAASTTPTGVPKDTYRVNEDVYAAGSGFTVSTNVDIYVVIDLAWDDGDPIPQDVTDAVETASVVNGDVGPVFVWHARLVPGRYDIIIDADRNDVYDANRWAGQRIASLCRGY